MKSIHEIAAEIIGKELQILDDFAKAYLAEMSYTDPRGIVGIIKYLRLNQKMTTNEKGEMGYKYWYDLRDDVDE